MTKEQLRMQMLAGIITESQSTFKLNEDAATEIPKVRKAMEDAIAKISDPADIERRINNVKFVIYNALDPNTNGGERPKPDFKFDDAWWASTLETADDYVIGSIYGELRDAISGKSFGEDSMN